MAELTVGSFNMHWGVDHRGRPFDVLGACMALKPDVLVLQESWRPNGRVAVADEIAAAMGAELHEVPFMSDRNSARPRHLTPPPGPAGTNGLAILSRLPVQAVQNLELPHARGDVIDRRHSILVTVTAGDAAVTVAGIHASHRLWGSLPQLRRVDEVLREIDGPSVIAGDCNMWGPPIATVLRGRRRAVRGRTWPAGRPHSQIDHIWIDDHLAVVDASIGPAAGSDHRPVRARIRVR